ncbi:ABC transporter ATP-binding protein [Lentisphaerota bacterium ZTH]|nr:ABC transporter ATP-binding protein [Lentisphaerota bacterium]WET07541.1 ABC transporter ATP-binding protein [Lentisphaerota bacterium ZTH]
MKIEVSNLTVGYDGGPPVLNGVDLGIKSGKVVTLIGPNGSGKSTMLKVIARTLRPYSGTVYIDDKNVHSFNTRKLARMMSVLPQSNSAPEDITVEELVEYGRFPYRRLLQGFSPADVESVDRALQLTGLETMRKRAVSALSGGERQRAWIALNLAQKPKVMLLDEPTTYLDVCHQFDIIDLIRRMNLQLGITIVMVLHDLNLAARYSDEIVVMKDGAIFSQGRPGDVIKEEMLREVFNIKAHLTMDEKEVPHFVPVGSCSRAVLSEDF